jgi:dihydroxyacetone kinase-like protein
MIRIDADVKTELIAAAAVAIRVHLDELTRLDQAIGDGDHGLNMARGLAALEKGVRDLATQPLPGFLQATGTLLVMTIGGASGPLYGTLFLEFGKALPGDFEASDIAPAFLKGVDGAAARGRSEAGQKTMLDVLYPVAEALAAGRYAELAAIAEAGAEATRPMKALRGRAAFLGDRSIGTVDPGARSAAVLVAAVASVLMAREDTAPDRLEARRA